MQKCISIDLWHVCVCTGGWLPKSHFRRAWLHHSDNIAI